MKISTLWCVALLLLVVCNNTADAQNTITEFPLALAYAEDELPQDLAHGVKGRIATCLARLCDSSHFFASGEEQTFRIVPRIDVLEEARIEGLEKINVVKLELSVNIQQTEGGINFGTYSWIITGSGNSPERAYRSALNSLPRSDENFTRFCSDIRPRINSYYAANCAQIIQRAQQFIYLNQFEEAILELIKVPTEASACSAEVEEKLQQAYDAYQREYCGPMLQEASALKAIGKPDEALDILIQVSPSSSCSEGAREMIEQIGNDISRTQQNKLDFAREMYRSSKASASARENLRLQRWITVSEIAKAAAAVVGGFSPSLNIPIYLGKQ
ncbi:hypothetical protein [Lewinella cohaerens]|uniref:hypothetical protein n=1 Tax=Lewinella cohaerens TaxID=70995 RepID=UPI00038145F2|nr:hypothetical protein [Lewinella cohaerens]